MMRKFFFGVFTFLFTFSVFGDRRLFDADVDGILRAFRFNQQKTGFFFGNHIDSHQKSFLVNQDADLVGWLFITFTGETDDNGVPVAVHCNMDTPAEDCVPGWLMPGRQGEAEFVYHYNDHPLWFVPRSEIPQPGAFSHFHWSGEPAQADGLIYGESYPGYFLELKALDAWITGLRRAQAVIRHELKKLEWDEAGGLVKLNPLAYWTEEETIVYEQRTQNPL